MKARNRSQRRFLEQRAKDAVSRSGQYPRVVYVDKVRELLVMQSWQLEPAKRNADGRCFTCGDGDLCIGWHVIVMDPLQTTRDVTL